LVTEDWLIAINDEFRKDGVEQRGRPWKALQLYSVEFNVSVNLSSDLANKIFEWFSAHSKPGVGQIGSLYESVYFFDTQFWGVSIPVIFGEVKINPFDSLDEIPESIKKEIMLNKRLTDEYVEFWGECINYGYGFDDLRKTSGLDPFGIQFLEAGDQELRMASKILNQSRPDSRAILTCRLAVEMFFKSYIALKKGLSEKEAKSISHNLNTGLDKFIEASGYDHWEKARETLTIFPEIHDRYKPQEIPLKQLWEGFSLAQSLGEVIIEEYTCRNILN
jgi:hypothetical protein